jgi:hypothetical protein
VSVFLYASAAAQEGYYGVGHDKWHQGFYSKLKRNDGQGSCCNLMDCRPTQSRMVGDHYEVKVDGVWMPVPSDKINNVVAPDGGAHVCAPRQVDQNKGIIFCRRRADASTRRVANAEKRKSHVKPGALTHPQNCIGDFRGGGAHCAGVRPEGRD